MFAVPGWSVSADTLKAQVETKASRPAKENRPSEANGTNDKSKKRKRGHGSSKITDVTEENLGDLWRKHIEGKIPGKPNEVAEGVAEGKDTKQKRNRQEQKTEPLEEAVDINGDFSAAILEEQEAHANKEGLPKKKKNAENHKGEYEESEIAQAIGYVKVAKATPGPENSSEHDEDGKSRYERRIAKAARRKEQRALLQANGTLPPTRPEAITGATTTAASFKPSNSKPSEAANAPAPSNKLVPTTSKEPPSAPNPPKASKALAASTALTPPNPPPSTTKLTVLQQRMAAKLTSARFRHLNQTLYTSASNEAMQLFADSPQAYTSYHAGFRVQVAVWPQNPVEGFVEEFKVRGRMSVPSQKKMWREMKKGSKTKEPISEEALIGDSKVGRQLDPLPRTRGVCTIADLGCGDAHLAGSLQPLKKALNLNLLSFDLAKGDTANANLITVADISNLAAVGVRDGGLDIAICCLSLMGTNWVDVVGECARVVRGGGEVWIAEIKSRFARPGPVKKKGDGIGKKVANRANSGDEGDEDEEAVALEELEDAKGAKDGTDVSPFVEVFRKRGFSLKGEPDMANKMFVRMRFVKAMRPEKAMENEKGGKVRFGEGFRGKQVGKTKFLEGEGEAEMDESKVLKPCVYKTR